MKLKHLALCAFLVLAPSLSHATYVVKGGKLINKDEEATLSVQEHYSLAQNAYQAKNWEEVRRQATIIIVNFPETPFANEILFHLGVAYFHLEEYERANGELSNYLKRQTTPKYFEEAIQYKFAIAEKFKDGERKHVMGWQNLPKWVSAEDEAIAIYDEVITALPHHDLGAQALFGKAKLLFAEGDYKACIDTFQQLIRRFPKHALAPESYICIGKVYLTQAQELYPDPDFLDLAEINLKRFAMSFPGEERVAISQQMLQEMKEFYANHLYETARFFERTKKPHASTVYYNKIIAKYPDTKVAEQSRERLAAIEKKKT